MHPFIRGILEFGRDSHRLDRIGARRPGREFRPPGGSLLEARTLLSAVVSVMGRSNGPRRSEASLAVFSDRRIMNTGPFTAPRRGHEIEYRNVSYPSPAGPSQQLDVFLPES